MPATKTKHVDPEVRPERVSMADQPRNILTVLNKEAEFHYRWTNDTNDRIARMEKAGYEVVTNGDLTIGDASVNSLKGDRNSPVTRPVGRGITGVLMRIKQEWYDEDQAKKHEEIDENELQMVAEHKQDRYGKGITFGS